MKYFWKITMEKIIIEFNEALKLAGEDEKYLPM
ncbi:hypothetical protein Fokcrypt_00411 [Candidatus Fokinia cryptica]|uniref:Uncharacterized protein n=1 Tax=Candidatus Fokinia crypta TaxID=1920990 RepID=A0ABZ0UT72_9RICK|nr:hypothetical protein Fokcrypt_00411 [Candidatus Fokinia cryptica]